MAEPDWLWAGTGLPEPAPALSLPLDANLIPSEASIMELCTLTLPSAMPEEMGTRLAHALDDFFDMRPPNLTDIASIKGLPVPPRSVVESLFELAPIHIRWGFLSVATRHLEPTSPAVRTPLWVITFWSSYYDIEPHYRAWSSALIKHSKLSSSRAAKDLATLAATREIFSVLHATPWSGHLRGFPQLTGTTDLRILSPFLNQEWLSDEHLSLLISLLQIRVLTRPSSTAPRLLEVQSSHFFTKLRQLYDDRSKREAYQGGLDSSWIWKLGNHLAKEGGLLAMPINLGNRHWVAVTIDFAKAQIRYGDSFGSSITENRRDIMRWWFRAHTQKTPKTLSLPITTQSDGFSCGILVFNALSHALLGEELLQPDSGGKRSAINQRLHALRDILHRHNNYETSETGYGTHSQGPPALQATRDGSETSDDRVSPSETRGYAEIQRLVLEHARLSQELRRKLAKSDPPGSTALPPTWNQGLSELQAIPEKVELDGLDSRLQDLTARASEAQTSLEERARELLEDACRMGIIETWTEESLMDDLSRCFDIQEEAAAALQGNLRVQVEAARKRCSEIESLISG